MCNADKVFDAVEVAGRNVMSTTSVVTTGLVTDRYAFNFFLGPDTVMLKM